jgi:hypothetical protein
MTPQEIGDYKRKWMPGYSVRLHSDLDIQGKDWCRKHLERYQWSFSQWTAVYEHTFHFEDAVIAQNFAMEFGRFANQPKDFDIESLDPDERTWYYDGDGTKRPKNQ